MTITPAVLPRTRAPFLALAVCAGLCGASVAAAAQPATPVIAPASPLPDYEQTARQQAVRDQLQKSQLERQLHQSVSDNARRPGASHANLQRQQDMADQAQRDRDRAAEQDQVGRYRDQAALPRVIPPPWPVSARSSGHD
jgi:hypothetical protein